MSSYKRVEELDIAKGIGIILIVLGHLEPGTYLMRFLYSFHLFLFFICSGFVGKRYEERKIIDIFLSDVKRLLFPYFVWNVLSQMVDLIIGCITFTQALDNLFFFDANVGWNAALWFLVSLFWADTICAIVIKSKLWIQVVFGIILLTAWGILQRFEIILPFGLYTVPIAALFWLMGYWINELKILDKTRSFAKVHKIAFFVFLFSVNFVFGIILNTVISIYHIKYENILFTMLAGICGTIMTLVISQYLCKCDWLKRILNIYGQNTLSILCTHYFLLRIIGSLSMQIIGLDLWRSSSTLKSIVLMICIMAIYYPLLKMLKLSKNKYPQLKYII